METKIKLDIPKWAIALYGAMAVLLIPWIIVLARDLPSRHISDHWSTLWVGFDILELIAIVTTFYFMIRRQVWVIISATALATLLIGDAWVDILTSKPGKQIDEAFLSGIIELTLSFMTFRLVYHILHKSTPSKKLKVSTKKKK
jgi:hypothetical protein